MMERRETLNIVREYSSGPVSLYRLLRAYSQKCREAESLLKKASPRPISVYLSPSVPAGS